MQSKTIGKIIVDLGMTVLLMLLMAFFTDWQNGS